MLDHIAFEVVNLAAFCKKLASAGVQFDVPFTKSVEGQSYATLTDPWGTSIELTEAAFAKASASLAGARR